MKLTALALDYDGTIARQDVLDPAVRGAIADVRRAGIPVLLVTGRILDDLRRVAGELHFVDAVVAENGAVLHFPDSGHTSLLAPEMSRAFLDEVSRRGLSVTAGHSLVDARSADASRLLEVIQALELPLVLLFNRSRVMTLPQGVSKATGLRLALETLRLSARSTVAVGDAENDHELLRLAEVGVAVAWGSAALQREADMTLQGTGPAAVASFLQELALSRRLPVVRARRRLRLGHTDDGREFSLAVRGRNVLVAGDARSGKSWIAGLLCEQLILHGYCVCVIDPEGDYRALEALPGVSVMGGAGAELPTPRELLHALRYPDRSIVIDLSKGSHHDKVAYVRALLPTLKVLREHTGLPHRIVLDEAHYFLTDGDGHELLDFDRHGYTIVTYRASTLPRQLLDASEVMIVTCESDPVEIAALRESCARCREGRALDWTRLATLRRGQAAALPVTEEAGGDLRLFAIAPRLTPHVRHREKYVDIPVAGHHAFVFPAGHDGRLQRVSTLREFVAELERISPAVLEPYVRRGDFSRWIDEVFGDHVLATDLRVIEEQHRRAPRGDTIAAIITSIRGRYDLAPGPHGAAPDAG
jgi:hydroxymethylpyrimidine pyrophosphatase-like HAD family hydrolase